MGGGAPSISGGMTEEQYKKLQMEERAFMAEQEEKQMRLMNEMEDKRTQREQQEIKRQQGLREAEEEALSKLEGQVSSEVENLKEDEEDEDKDVVMDFYGSLAKNQNMGSSGKVKNTAQGVKPL
jgi:hypothetical protein